MLALLLRTHRIRCYSTSPTPFPPLPPASEWRRQAVSEYARRPRLAVGNSDTAQSLAEAIFPPERETPGGKGKVVVEAFAGPGVLTRALLQLPASRIRKLIVLENTPKFHGYLKELEAFDSRVTALCVNPHSWDSYEKIEEEGLFNDIGIQDWQSEPDLEFVGIIPHSVSGEQLVAQLLRAIPERSWLFKYGRMRMNLLMPDQLYQRIDAPLSKAKRCKLSVVAEATARFQHVISPLSLRPYDDHFWPPSYIPKSSVPATRRPGNPMVAIRFDPLEDQPIQPGMLDKWDYCLRRMFVLRSYELKKALPSLAPGATNMLQYIQGPDVAPEDKVDVQQRINALTVQDWQNIVNAFNKWPFAPEKLYVDNSFSDEILR